jgi:diguanylate cyclase (GGDEF)-like protein
VRARARTQECTRDGFSVVIETNQQMLASTMTLTTWVVVALAACAFLATASAVIFVLRWTSNAGTPSTEGDDLRYILDSVRRSEHEKELLANSLQVAHAAVARRRRLEDIGAKLDLDVVLERAFDAARDLLEVDAAAISLLQPRGEPVVATFGLVDLAEQRLPLHEPLGGSTALATTYDHVGRRGAPGPESIRAGLTLNLLDDDEIPLGLLALYWRENRPSLRTEDVELAEELARAIAPPIVNGMRYRNATRKADIDGLTELRHNTAFRDALATEVARARRYDRKVALLVFDVDEFKAINDRFGHLVGDAILAELGARLTGLVRLADVPCRIGGDEFAVILPESTTVDALSLFERLQASAREHDSFAGASLSFSGGIAELRPGEEEEPFFHRADQALLEAKGQGKDRAFVADGHRAPSATSSTYGQAIET